MNVIVHDVARTKIVHPLFESGGNGLAMLKRVLLRCVELGAVKEAGYIQVGGPDDENMQGGRGGTGCYGGCVSLMCMPVQNTSVQALLLLFPAQQIFSPIGAANVFK